MVADTERLARVFLWKKGDAPDAGYARELLKTINPDAYRAIAGDAPPLQLFTVAGPWPDDPWVRALEDMDAVPAPTGTRWTDSANYDLAGWQGKDLRTGEELFVVTAYRRPAAPAIGTQYDTVDRMKMQQPVAQTPYQPQYPTGPIAWPPYSRGGKIEGDEAYKRLQAAAYYQSQHSSTNIESLETTYFADNITGPLAAAIQANLLDSYAPYYATFGSRLVAMLIDSLFTVVFPVFALSSLLLRGQPRESSLPLGQYALVAGLALLVFFAYHTVQVGLWGQTLGKALMGIKVVAPDGSLPGFGRAALRVLGYGFSLLPAGWGFLLMAVDPRRQALHDRIAGTVVIPEKLELAVPAGLIGYSKAVQAADMPLASANEASQERATQQPYSAVGMAAVAAAQEYDRAQLSTVPQLPEAPALGGITPALPPRTQWELTTLTSGLFPGVDRHSVRLEPRKGPNVEKARAQFKSALTELERGNTPAVRGYKVEPQAAKAAATLLKEALELVPSSVVYRYFYAVALRYSEGIESALREFKRVLELDPGHYEAQQQMTYGARWHDAFAYPAWVSPAPVEVGRPLPEAITALLPEGGDTVTRMALLREGGNKRSAFLSRTSLSAWSTPPSLHMQASLHLMLSRTAHGPILVVYVMMHDNMHRPFLGEAFLNPREQVQNTDDACQLGQHMLEQLARQDRTYFIFADENNHLLLSRKVSFNTTTQVSIARVLYETQTLPQQTMEPERFVEAAKWHMEHVSLDQIREQFLSDSSR